MYEKVGKVKTKKTNVRLKIIIIYYFSSHVVNLDVLKKQDEYS